MVFVTGSTNIFGWLPIAMLFAIIFVVCFWLLPVLKLQGFSRLVAALCVAALCILGMMTSGTPPEAAQESEPHAVTMTFVLIPYTALGLSLVLMALLLLVMRWASVGKKRYRVKAKQYEAPLPFDQDTSRKHCSKDRTTKVQSRNKSDASIPDVLDNLRSSLNRITPEQKKGQEAHWPPTPFSTNEPFSCHPRLVGRSTDDAQHARSQDQGAQGRQGRQGNQIQHKGEDQTTRRGQGRR